MFIQSIDTPLGRIRVRADAEAVTEICLSDASVPDAPNALTAEAARQIAEYFAGSRRAFDLPLQIAGSPFRQAVYRALREIPFGETVTYGALAAKAGHPGAARAVGMAMKCNPLLLVVPCHRVLASGGLGGFSCGLDRKRLLLRLEGHDFPESF